MISSVRIVACIFGVIAVLSVCLARYFWNESNLASDPPNRYRDPADWGHLAVGALFGATGLFSLSVRWPSAASLTVVISADLYLAVVLVVVAVRGDRSSEKRHAWAQKAIPHRLFALFSLSLTFLALVAAFGSLYLNSRGICPAGDFDCYSELPRVPDGDGKNTNDKRITRAAKHPKGLVTPLDGAYFSMVTMMTVGFGDYVAVNDEAKELVIFQLGSGGFLLLCAFPLVASRMATW